MAAPGPVVLIHAFPLNASLWDPQRDAMPDGWRLHAPDLPGFGASAAATPPSDDEHLHTQISGSRLALIPRAGHLASFEQPQLFNQALGAFLESIS